LFYMNNMASMFAINAIFYSCYLVSASIYLMTLLANKEKLSKIMGMVAFCWAMATHGGTGAIFGLISTRETMVSGLRPFEFILAALTSSLALLVVVIVLMVKITGRQIKDELVISLGRFVAFFLCGLILLIWIGNLTHGYLAGREALAFMLAGPFSLLFWGFQVLLGESIPLVILFHPKARKTVIGVTVASILIVIGVFFERLNLIIPGLSYPQQYFPGKIEGIYGAVGSFPLTPVESFMSLGIFALMGLLFVLGLKNLELLPAGENIEQNGRIANDELS
ncbi:MAG: polysulfide reductase NrfD, partial [Anaerolineaceae bacterium]|nr:polysulfide reductase NrfD [Anaerolineaceae bacterium]